MTKPKTDLTGQTFANGQLTVICQGPDYKSKNQRPRTQWLCQCKCGNQKLFQKNQLEKGLVKSCGCLQYKHTNRKPSITIGMIFGDLEVIAKAPDHYTPSKIKKPQWLCRCVCKKEIVVQQQILKLNGKTHCGCKRSTANYNSNNHNTYDLTGPYGIGYTTKGEPFWFDLDDYDKLKNFTWRYDKRGYVTTTTPKNSGLPKILELHKLVMPTPPDDMIIDHKEHPAGLNAHKFDNRKKNLRFVTIAQNNQNRSIRQDNSSGHTGVYFDTKNNRWTAHIKHNKKQYRKRFMPDQFQEACDWRDNMEKQLFGEYRCQNTDQPSSNI